MNMWYRLLSVLALQMIILLAFFLSVIIIINKCYKNHNNIRHDIERTYVSIDETSDDIGILSLCDSNINIAINLEGALKYNVNSNIIYPYQENILVDFSYIKECIDSNELDINDFDEAVFQYKEFLSFVERNIEFYKICGKKDYNYKVESISQYLSNTVLVEPSIEHWLIRVQKELENCKQYKHEVGFKSYGVDGVVMNFASFHMGYLLAFLNDLFCILRCHYCNNSEDNNDIKKLDSCRSELKDLVIQAMGVVKDYMASNPDIGITSYVWMDKILESNLESNNVSANQVFNDIQLIPDSMSL